MLAVYTAKKSIEKEKLFVIVKSWFSSQEQPQQTGAGSQYMIFIVLFYGTHIKGQQSSTVPHLNCTIVL